MTRRRTCLTLGVLLLAGACVNPRADQARLARATLVGMPENVLLSCAGAPERAFAANGVQYLTYASRQVRGTTGASLGFGVFGGSRHAGLGLGYGFGAPLATDVRSDYCEATFAVQNGRVAEVNYVGAGPSRLSQCSYIVESCLARLPPPPAF